MRITPLRTIAMASLALAAFVFTPNQASAAAYVDVRVGPSGPPPVVVERPWARPYRGAVWIPGAYDWRDGRYVWRSGYYDYPPRRGSVWVRPRYVHREGAYYYRPGRWD